MANIFTSSIGKKLIMSVTGLFLIIFLLLHATINGLSLISADAFRAGCDFMALPIITVMVPILAAGFIIHIIYAIYLSWTNYKARGNNRYAVANKSQADNWAAKNMLVLGIVVLGLLAFHLTHFWADMQLLQFQGVAHENLPDPYGLLLETFGTWWVTVLYGFWSAFHTLGWNNNIWISRLKVISYIVATIICLVFVAVAVVSCLKANAIL